MKKGIFWILPTGVLTVTISCDSDGNIIKPLELLLNAKTGTTYNHKLTWESISKDITGGHSYNYYPRGRVEIRNNKAIIYLNPTIGENYIEDIKELFELGNIETVIKKDGSEHYRCSLD